MDNNMLKIDVSSKAVETFIDAISRGTGTLDFITCNEIVLSEDLAGYCLMYRTVNADDDKIESEEE